MEGLPIASVAPVPRWIWWQLAGQMVVSFVLSFPVPFIALGFTLVSFVEIVWASARLRRWHVYQEQLRDRIRAVVVEPLPVLPSGRPALPSGVPVRSQRVG